MTVELDAIKSLAVDGVELKKLYANNQLVWKRTSGWRRQLDLYPRAVRNDGEGNLYVLASSKVQSTGSPTQLKMFKLNEDGDILFSVDLKKMNANISYSQMGFIVAGDYIYIPIYNYLFQIDKKDGGLVKKVVIKSNDFVYAEHLDNDIVLISKDNGGNNSYEVLSIPNLISKKYSGIGYYEVVDSKVYKNILYMLSFVDSDIMIMGKDFETKLFYAEVPEYSIAIDVDDTYFYVADSYYLLKYDKSTKKKIWQIEVATKTQCSLLIINNQIILENDKGFFIFENIKGELIFSKKKENELPISSSNNLLAKINDKYFCRLAYNEKAIYKLELGDEDNYENLN